LKKKCLKWIKNKRGFGISMLRELYGLGNWVKKKVLEEEEARARTLANPRGYTMGRGGKGGIHKFIVYQCKYV